MKSIIILFIIIVLPVYLSGGESNKTQAELIKQWQEDSQKILKIITELRAYRQNDNDTEIQANYKKEQFPKKLNEINKKYLNKLLVINNVIVKDVTEEKTITIYGFEKVCLIVNLAHQQTTGKKITSERKIRRIFKKFKKGIDKAKLTNSEKKIMKELVRLMEYPSYSVAAELTISKCEKCYKTTGAYIITYLIPIPKDTDDSTGGFKNIDFEYGIQSDEKNKFFDGQKYKIIEVKIIQKMKDKNKAFSISKGQASTLSGKIKNIDIKINSISEEITITIEK